MGTPNYPFSLILNTKKNPYITNSNYNEFYSSILMEKTQAENLYQLNNQAIARVRAIADEQRNIFKLLDEEIRKYSDKGLQEILQNPSMVNKINSNGQQQSDNNKIDANAIKKQLIEENRTFNLEYQKLLLDIANAKTEEEVNTILSSLNTILQKVGQTLNNIREKINTRLNRINALQHQGALSNNISFSENGEIQIARGKGGTELKRQFHEYRDFLEKQNKLGTYFTRGVKGKKDTFSVIRDKYVQNIHKLATSYFSSKNNNNFELGAKLADRFVSMMQKAFMTGEKTFNLATSEELNQIAQEGGFIWEEVSNQLLINEFTQAIKEDPMVLIEGGSITGHVRIAYRIALNQKTKDELKEKGEIIRAEVNNYFDELVEQTTELDKIDDYINFTFKAQNQKQTEQRYTIAFSDKMYKNLKNISIITGMNKLEAQISGASTLLNTYDLIDSIGAQADAFIFSALNSSTASAFYNPNNRESIKNELTKLFSSFIYETAYNPDSFVSQVLESLNFSNSKVLYVHKIGLQVVPAFLMLEQVAKSLELIQSHESDRLEIVKTKISFDNTSSYVFYNEIKEKYPRPRGKEYKEQRNFPLEAWKYVAEQAANNTYINMHIDITPLSSILNQPWY